MTLERRPANLVQRLKALAVQLPYCDAATLKSVEADLEAMALIAPQEKSRLQRFRERQRDGKSS
jgi:hypothetical protein